MRIPYLFGPLSVIGDNARSIARRATPFILSALINNTLSVAFRADFFSHLCAVPSPAAGRSAGRADQISRSAPHQGRRLPRANGSAAPHKADPPAGGLCFRVGARKRHSPQRSIRQFSVHSITTEISFRFATTSDARRSQLNLVSVCAQLTERPFCCVD